MATALEKIRPRMMLAPRPRKTDATFPPQTFGTPSSSFLGNRLSLLGRKRPSPGLTPFNRRFVGHRLNIRQLLGRGRMPRRSPEV